MLSVSKSQSLSSLLTPSLTGDFSETHGNILDATVLEFVFDDKKEAGPDTFGEFSWLWS